MFVTLSTFDSNTQEGVGETDRSLLRLLEIPSCPEQGQAVSLGKKILITGAAGLGHRLAVVEVTLVGLTTLRSDDAFDDLVVGHVVVQTNSQPLVPQSSCRIANWQHIVELLVAVACPVAKASRPPGSVARRFEQLVDQLLSLIRSDESERNSRTSSADGRIPIRSSETRRMNSASVQSPEA